MEYDEIEWLGSKEAARYLGITAPTLYRLANSGEVAGFKIGRVLRFRRSDLDAFLETARIQPGELTHLIQGAKSGEDQDATKDTSAL